MRILTRQSEKPVSGHHEVWSNVIHELLVVNKAIADDPVTVRKVMLNGVTYRGTCAKQIGLFVSGRLLILA